MLPTAVVFPGQGSQSVGMLADVIAAEPLCKQVFERASRCLQLDLLVLISEQTSSVVATQQRDALNETVITQPLMLTAGIAIWQYMAYHGYTQQVACVAGHSLGEYTALVASGVLKFEDALLFVRLRGELMQQAVRDTKTAMRAVIGLTGETVRAITNAIDDCYAVNFNSPEQTVIAGLLDAVERGADECKRAGAKLVIPIAVSVPSHCPLMDSVQRDLADALISLPAQDACLPVYQNVTATPETSARVLISRSIGQLSRPVLWHQTICNMRERGITRYIEAGSGRVLAGLIKRIDRSLAVKTTDTLDNLRAAASLFAIRS